MPSLDRQYKFRADWEGSQYWTDPITIIPHEVNEIDMDLDLLGFDLTGDRLYVNNRSKGKKIQLAMVGLPYGLFVSSVIAAPSVSETIYYYHNDHLGTPQVLTDDNAQVVWKADYKPFGEVDIVVETVENNFRFPGQYFDKETGLHYNYFRDYHPGIGRFLTPDPSHSIQAEGTGIPYLVLFSLNSPQELNNYPYGQNNPVKLTDPFGLEGSNSNKCKDECKRPFYCELFYTIDVCDCLIQYPEWNDLQRCVDEAKARKKECCETGKYPPKYDLIF